MLIVISFLGVDGEIQPFYFSSNQLEISFNIVTHFARQGHTLLSATIRESNGHITPLPIEVINGETLTEYIERLQREWELIWKSKV